ncbi:MAG: DNA-protecting protein DprA [Actinobacteria bacterium]|nr:DNA-protecting protein DprA [Actinomycetota bacterium]
MMEHTPDSNKKYWLGLKMIPAFRNQLYMLADNAGGPDKLWNADRSILVELGLSERVASKAVAARNSLDLESSCRKLKQEGIEIITDDDGVYPELLRQAPGHPKAIFVRGALQEYETAVAIVGTRRSTISGKAIASELAADLARAGVIVVSGVARGIDTCAHWGAIEAGGLTLGVLGCGSDIIYPPENRRLYKKIEVHGALISEYPPGTPPLAQHFPARNRIVAGMCQGVVVVEAGEKSGALITADFALDYGREVFAVPGHSRSHTSQGANRLIKQGAYLVETVDDILGVLGIEQSLYPQTDALTQQEKEFLEALGWEARRLDEIIRQTGASIASTSAILLSLEIAGFIKKDLAGSFIRVR